MRHTKRLIMLIAFMTVTISAGAAELSSQASEQEQEEIQAANKQEYVEVRGDKYPGLQIEIATPAENLLWRPPKKAPPPYVPNHPFADYRPLDFHATSTARPHQTGKLVSIPIVEE